VLRAPPAVRVLSQAYTVTDNTSDIALNMLLHQPVRDWLNGMHLPLSRSFRLDLTRLRHTLLRDVAVRKFASLEDRVLWAFSAKGVEEEPEFRDFESGVRLLLPSELAEQILQNGR
jgi:hypothetical protein